VTGKHRGAGLLARHPRLARWLAPGAAAAGALLIILLAGFAIWGLPSGAGGNQNSAASRTALDRGSRDEERSGAPSSPSASPSSASPSALPSASRTAAPGPVVVSTGTCKATFYGTGTGTASGERFNPDAMTAAHKTLPFGTRVRVTNLANGKQVTVRINDRGPYGAGRCLDLTTAAFKMIGSTSTGVLNVRYEVLKS
jgi:rare lipoprotein A